MLVCSFHVVSLSDFGIRVVPASKNEFGSVLLYSISWKILRRININSSLNIGYIPPVKSFGPGHFFFGRFLISLIVIGLSRFPISS